MLKKHLIIAFGCIYLVLLSCSAFAQEEAVDQARIFTTWDEYYFYVAVQVDSTDVRGISKAPNSPVDAGDDSVTVYIDRSGGNNQSPTTNTVAMTVSAAGGSFFRKGTADGELKPETVWSFKYGVGVQGTLNNNEDIDLNYIIEMAIPWDLMDSKQPTIGDMIAINVVIHRSEAEKNEFISLSNNIQTEADRNNPSKWAKLVFAAHSFLTATIGREKIVSPKYVVRAPLIDGRINENEWHRNTSVALNMPMPEGFVYEAKFPPQKLVMATYYYDYQGDENKSSLLNIHQNGKPYFTYFPSMNTGPWFGYERVGWHKNELRDAASAGINVILPVFGGSPQDLSGYALKGLDTLVTALDELRFEGKPYPMVALYLNTNTLIPAYGGKKPDMNDTQAKEVLYNLIKAFYQRVPSRYCAIAQADKPNAGKVARIVFMSSIDPFINFTSDVINYCNERFMADFGMPLVWAGDDSFSDIVGFDSYFSLDADNDGVKLNDKGKLRTVVLSPGYFPSQLAESAGFVTRDGGDYYVNNWNKAIDYNPHWIICDSWNNHKLGNEICATRQYGRKYIEITKAQRDKFFKNLDYNAEFLSINIPNKVVSGSLVQGEAIVRNGGNLAWRMSDGYSISYRWYRNGRFFGESKYRLPISKDVAPGDTIVIPFGIAAVNSQGIKLPDGDCEMRIELLRLSDNRWFSSLGDDYIMLPLTISNESEEKAVFVADDIPSMVASGSSYNVKIKVRNDTSASWQKDTTKLVASLKKVYSKTLIHNEESETIVPIKDISSVLKRECKPGQTADFTIDFNILGADGKPVEEWNPQKPWSYVIDLNIVSNGSKITQKLSQAISIYSSDYGVRFADSDIPQKLNAGKKINVKVVIANNGKHKWDKKRTQIGYRWYYADGTKAPFEGEIFPINTDIAPGWPTVLNASVTAPNIDGYYVIVWDMMVDGKWLSSEPLTRGNDLLPVFVEVVNGLHEHAILDDYFNITATSPNTDRSTGDFDGKGYSIPAELILPDISATAEQVNVYPAGYNTILQPSTEPKMSFVYPDKSSGAKNAVKCIGQKILLKTGKYKSINFLAASC
ncbi:MAG: sugar-binding protein, partial [Armatimonadota bacterium]